MTTSTALLFLAVLLIGHTLADFTPLQSRGMLQAKARASFNGIVPHGLVHGLMVGVITLLFGFGYVLALVLLSIELFIHTFTDWAKAQLSVRYQSFADPTTQWYWTLLGIDQLCHTLTKVLIVCIVYSYQA